MDLLAVAHQDKIAGAVDAGRKIRADQRGGLRFGDQRRSRHLVARCKTFPRHDGGVFWRGVDIADDQPAVGGLDASAGRCLDDFP